MDSVGLSKSGKLHHAAVTMEKGHGLAMSEIEKALEVANKEMGYKMGSKYVVADSFSLAFVHYFKTAKNPDQAKLESRLKKLEGFRSVWVMGKGFGVEFRGKKLPSIADVRKASGRKIVDTILAPSEDGGRHTCPMHPEKVSAGPAKCPSCGMKMKQVAASVVSE